jgi:hypothetical protein
MPGLLEDIITDHAGTVMGGSHERSGPCNPFRQRHFKLGKSSSQRSKTNSGAAQSRPISITRGRCLPLGAAGKGPSRVDSDKSTFLKAETTRTIVRLQDLLTLEKSTLPQRRNRVPLDQEQRGEASTKADKVHETL